MTISSHLIYEGKCKKVFKVKDREDLVWLEFKDNLTAYNGKKKSSFKGKGKFNRNTSSLIFRYLQSKGIQNHWVSDEGEIGMTALKIKMIPLEVVVRNRLAGSTAKKFNKPDGEKLKDPLFEFYYKNEELGDPFISMEQAAMLGVFSNGGGGQSEAEEIKNKALKINKELAELFSQVNIDLIDFKIEFGRDFKGRLILGDEISADSCRLWRAGTKERLDKDRFRLDLGHVEEGYQEVYESLSKAVKK